MAPGNRVQFVSMHSYPQTRHCLSGDPSLTYPCLCFSFLRDEPLVRQIQQRGSGEPSSDTVHSLVPRLSALCMKLQAVSAELRHCCLPHASETWPCWAPYCLRAETFSQSQPWDYADPLNLHFCSFANQWAEVLDALTRGSAFKCFLRAEEHGQKPPMTYLSPTPNSVVPADLPLLIMHSSSLGCPLLRCHAAASCSFLGITVDLCFEAKIFSNSSSDHYCKSHHDPFIHSAESRHEGTQ